MDLSIVIVSYNTKTVLQSCLEAINNSRDTLKKEVIIVDNASTDGSAQMVAKTFKNVHLIKQAENPGFGTANNVGGAQAKGDYILFLNSDAFVHQDSLQVLIDKAKRKHALLATGSLQNPNGTIQPQGGELPTIRNLAAWMFFIDDLPLIGRAIKAYQQRHPTYFTKDRVMGWVGGTAMLVEKKLFHTLHGFNTNIFMYAEDVDICLRAKQLAHVKIWFFVIPPITHIGQASGSKQSSLVGECRGLLYLFKTYYPKWQYPLIRLLLKIGSLVRLLLFGIILGSEDKKRAYQSILALD